MVELLLQREKATKLSVPGTLRLNGGPAAIFTLEPAGKQIPAGKYAVRLTASPRMKCWVPLLLDVTGRSAIEMHPGNTAHDSEGCILSGFKRVNPDQIGESCYANLLLLYHILSALHRGEEVWITVLDYKENENG